MTALAIQNPDSSMGKLLHFSYETRIEELEALVKQLNQQRSRLQRSLNRRRQERKRLLENILQKDMFIRGMAQEYFSQDENSRYMAGKAHGRPVSREEIIAHWRDNKGPENFARQFPTAESLIKYFRLLHIKRRK